MPSFQLSTAVGALIRATRPEFKRSQDRVAYAAHAYYLCQGYTLVGVNTPSEGTPPATDAREVSLEGWNDNGELYVFTYAHAKELQPVLVKCFTMGNVVVVCATSLVADGSQPRTLDVRLDEVTNDDAETQGYTDLNALVQRFVSALGEFNAEPSQPTQTVTRPEPVEQRVPPMDRPVRPNVGIVGGYSDLFPVGVPGGVPGGGSQIGLNDRRFTPHLRHPELQPGRGGIRYDPMAPPGVPGYFPDDFQPHRRNRLDPDLAQPGPRNDFDPDNMFG